jgi:hypothetical protein
MYNLKTVLLASVLTIGAGSMAFAQSASSVTSGGSSSTPSSSSATGGSGGSASAGGTSASTLGLGGTSTGENGTSSSIGVGGSAAGGTKDTSSSKVTGNQNNLNGMSKARAQDKGTWSRSMTHEKVHKGEVSTRTKSMAHEPGGPPTKSTTSGTFGAGQ